MTLTLRLAAAALAGFLLGSVPFGYLVHRRRTGGDVRRVGSGNIGATNVARALGTRTGLAVLLLDACKGASAVTLGGALAGAPGGWAGGAAAVLGHVYCPWLGFGGGKGVATGLGVFLLVAPRPALAGIVVFLAIVAATRRVSLGSLVAALVVVAGVALERGVSGELAVAALIGLVVLSRHRDNLRRLRDGSEPRFGPSGRRRSDGAGLAA